MSTSPTCPPPGPTDGLCAPWCTGCGLACCELLPGSRGPWHPAPPSCPSLPRPQALWPWGEHCGRGLVPPHAGVLLPKPRTPTPPPPSLVSHMHPAGRFVCSGSPRGHRVGGGGGCSRAENPSCPVLPLCPTSPCLCSRPHPVDGVRFWSFPDSCPWRPSGNQQSCEGWGPWKRQLGRSRWQSTSWASRPCCPQRRWWQGATRWVSSPTSATSTAPSRTRPTARGARRVGGGTRASGAGYPGLGRSRCRGCADSPSTLAPLPSQAPPARAFPGPPALCCSLASCRGPCSGPGPRCGGWAGPERAGAFLGGSLG